jgi:hypothetical protein
LLSLEKSMNASLRKGDLSRSAGEIVSAKVAIVPLDERGV